VFHVKHEGWEFAAEQLGFGPLSPSAAAQLDRFCALLEQRAAPMGMIARGDVPILRERHVLDSLRAAPVLAGVGSVCDIGSGAGLPGIPLAVVRPDIQLELVEVRRHRAEFLSEVVAELGLRRVEIYPRRVETLKRSYDVCLARAFGGATTVWQQASRLLKPGGRLIYWAGERFDPEVDVPIGVKLELFRTPSLARSGPLAIMTA
jgi:16S rRNA (guanine527-N7)-methyltransferase